MHVEVHLIADITTISMLYRCESLHKCTGIHAAALCHEDTVQVQHWNKGTSSDPDEEHEWDSIVGQLDAENDLVLFPSDDATSINEINWNNLIVKANNNILNEGRGVSEISEGDKCHGSSCDYMDIDAENSCKYMRKNCKRLVVLEATWSGGKTMARQIVQIRQRLGLPPLQYVTLNCTGVTARYWRFQTVGNSAVSTIEAISHAAAAAGATNRDVETLLTLFNVQKYRVVNAIKSGGKVPRAMEVSGTGLGSWK
jgi:hypothetical protein